MSKEEGGIEEQNILRVRPAAHSGLSNSLAGWMSNIEVIVSYSCMSVVLVFGPSVKFGTAIDWRRLSIALCWLPVVWIPKLVCDCYSRASGIWRTRGHSELAESRSAGEEMILWIDGGIGPLITTAKQM